MEHDWFVATALAVRDQRGRPLDGRDAPHLSRRPQARLLLLARIPDRAPAVRRAVQPRHHRRRARGAARSRRRPRSPAQARARRRARQRRPRPARRLLHGEHGDARHPRARLRHPLRPRHLPPGDQGRLAARAAGGLAVRRQSVGVRAAGGHVHRRLRRPRRDRRERGRHVALGVGAGRERERGGVRHADHRLARQARQHAAAVVGARDGPDPPRRLQPRRPRRRARRPRARRVDLARALSERRHRGRAGAAAAPGILLRLGVAAGPRCAATRRSTASSRRSPTTWRSSSTTRIRRSPSRS